jgi:hypothetical protein
VQKEVRDLGGSIMNAVIGLITDEQKINQELSLLNKAGFTEDNIQVFSLDREVEKFFSHEKYSIIGRYAGWGAFIAGVIYTIFALVAAWCDCNLLHYSQEISFVIVPVGLLVGGLIGGFLGLISGIAEYENEITPYTQGVRMGGKVIAVQVDEGESEKAKQVLQSSGINRARTIFL